MPGDALQVAGGQFGAQRGQPAQARALARIAGQADSPALVTSTRRRRFLKTVVATRGLQLPVLSFEEIGLDAKPAVLAVVAA